MIDKNKLVSKVEAALAGLAEHAAIVDLALAFDPTDAAALRHKAKNEGGRELVQALLKGIADGVYDVEPDTIPAPAPKFGVFYTQGGELERSVYIDGEYATQGEAWAAVYGEYQAGGLSPQNYQVRPL